MKYHPRFAFLPAFLFLASTCLLRAQNLLANPSFEDGNADWDVFIPPDSQASNCQFTISTDSPHSGKNCAQLHSDQIGRFAIVPKIDFNPNPGERYHISAWVKASPDTQVQPGQPGIVIRVTLTQNGQPAAGGHYFLGVNNVMTRGPNPLPLAPPTPSPSTPTPAAQLPTQWTKLEADFTIPDDADKVGFDFFAWGTQGTVYFDDVSLEKLP